MQIMKSESEMEESKLDDMYMENLEEWVFEDEKIVTYKYLSRSLKVHVNVAKQMLFNFVETKKSSHPNIGVVYLVSGLVKNNLEDEANDPYDQRVMFVKQENLDQTLKDFSTVLSQHIYSVQQNNSTVSVSSLYSVDKSKPGQDLSVMAGLNPIKHKNAVPREAQKAPIVVKKEIKTEPAVKKEKETSKKKTGGIQDAFTKTSKKASPEKSQPAKSSVSTKTRAAAGIAGMFAKQASSKPKAKSNEEKENIVNQKIEANTSGGSKDSSPEKKEEVKPSKKSSSSGSKPTKSSGKKTKSSQAEDSKKRKRIQVMSDSEEEEEAEEDKADDKGEASGEDSPPVSKLIESEDEEDIPATPVQQTNSRSATGRKRVKKLVDKTYMDEKG